MPLGASRLSFLAKTATAGAAGRTAASFTNNGAEIDTAQSQFGGSSMTFPTFGDTLYVDRSDLYDFGTDDFTIEFWVRVNGDSGAVFFNAQTSDFNNGWVIRDFGTQLRIILYNSGSATNVFSPSSIDFTDGSWHHCAIVRNSGTVTFYMDGTAGTGVSYSTAVNTVTNGDSHNLTIGYAFEAGYIDEIRFSTTARYTSSFTSPTSAFTNDADTLLLVHADGTDGSTEFVDDTGTAGFVVGSVSYSGTTDNYSNQSINTTGAASGLKTPSAITVVFLAKPTYNLERLNIMGISDLNNTLRNNIFINTSGTIRFYNALASGTSDRTSTETLTNNDWNLVAISKDVGTGQISGWMNGSSITFPSETITGTTFDFDGSATDIGISTARAGDHNTYMWNGDVAWVGVWPTYTDFTNSTNQDAVWDSTNSRAIFPGTDGTRYAFGDPIIFHYGNESTVATNQGNIASYTLAQGGTPTDGDHYVATLGEEPPETTSNTSINLVGGDYGYIAGPSEQSGSNSYSFFSWVKFDAGNVGDHSFITESFRNGKSALRVQKQNTKFMVDMYTSTNSQLWRAQAANTFSSDTWYAVWVAIDPSDTSKRDFYYQQYGSSTVTQVSSSSNTIWTNNTGVWDSAYYDQTKDIGIGARGANGAVAMRGDLAEFWIDIAYHDFSNATNRQKFVDSSGYPVDLGSDGSTPFGAAPEIYLAGSDILTNNRGDSGDNPVYVGSPGTGDAVGS